MIKRSVETISNKIGNLKKYFFDKYPFVFLHLSITNPIINKINKLDTTPITIKFASKIFVEDLYPNSYKIICGHPRRKVSMVKLMGKQKFIKPLFLFLVILF